MIHPCRSTTSRIKSLIIGILILGIYLTVHQPMGDSSPRPPHHTPTQLPPLKPDIHINIEEIERELLKSKSRRIDMAFDSPFNKEFFYGKITGQLVIPSRLDLKGITKKREVIQKVEEKITNKYNEIWTWADKTINRQELFPDISAVDTLLDALAHAKIVNVDTFGVEDYESGTSEKWLVTLEGGQKAVMKLIWENKGKMKPHAECNLGYEIPSSEIAGFHLHRILGFRNTPYVSGRKVDLQREILPAATPAVRKQIHKVNKTACVTGKCYFCKKKDTLCPPGGIAEASIAFWVPRPLKLYTYPPGYMPYSTPRMEEWSQYGFNNRTYCNKLQRDIAPYHSSWYYLDLFDFAVLDTLMYHYDSKHYVIYDNSEARGLTVRLDHGRAFCASDRDELDVFLAPLTQCCTLRHSTYNKLKAVRHGKVLTSRLRRALQKDPLDPVLDNVWYPALERRLKIIWDTIEKCAKANGGLNKVLVDE